MSSTTAAIAEVVMWYEQGRYVKVALQRKDTGKTMALTGFWDRHQAEKYAHDLAALMGGLDVRWKDDQPGAASPLPDSEENPL